VFLSRFNAILALFKMFVKRIKGIKREKIIQLLKQYYFIPKKCETFYKFLMNEIILTFKKFNLIKLSIMN